MFTNRSQIVHTVFTNVKYTIIRKKERKYNKNEKSKNVKIKIQWKPLRPRFNR